MASTKEALADVAPVIAGTTEAVVELTNFVDSSKSGVLNNDPNTSLSTVLKSNGQLKSDKETDHQLLIFIPFTEAVKLRDMSIVARSDAKSDDESGPKTIKLFANQPNLNFGDTDTVPETQLINLSANDLKGTTIPLKFVKFQNVTSITLLVEANQGETDVTFINKITFFGTPLQGTDMKQFKACDKCCS